ncbi:unnamed protein product, partial [Ectocarpus sp. 8 AP-2014]
ADSILYPVCLHKNKLVVDYCSRVVPSSRPLPLVKSVSQSPLLRGHAASEQTDNPSRLSPQTDRHSQWRLEATGGGISARCRWTCELRGLKRWILPTFRAQSTRRTSIFFALKNPVLFHAAGSKSSKVRKCLCSG